MVYRVLGADGKTWQEFTFRYLAQRHAQSVANNTGFSVGVWRGGSGTDPVELMVTCQPETPTPPGYMPDPTGHY